MTHYHLNALGLCSPLGCLHQSVLDNLLQGNRGLSVSSEFDTAEPLAIGSISEALPLVPEALSSYDCRNNRLALKALESIKSDVEQAIVQYGASRVAVVMGTSTSGILSREIALQSEMDTGSIPDDYHYKQQEIGTVAEFLAQYLQLENLALTISTACSSSARALGVARNLLEANVCDAVLVGGVDSLCRLTLHGFSALQAVSATPCVPFSANRSGINIGEASVLFLMEKEPRGSNNITLCGFGESSDAHHVSAPDPEGGGAKRSMVMALSDAQLKAEDINYINLHGTATPLNDAMESKAVFDIFADKVACSSTKALTGHTLGAAGALEAAFCWLLLSSYNKNTQLPPQIFDGVRDTTLPTIALVEASQKADTLRYCLSNSFAFGGNNATVVLGALNE